MIGASRFGVVAAVIYAFDYCFLSGIFGNFGGIWL